MVKGRIKTAALAVSELARNAGAEGVSEETVKQMLKQRKDQTSGPDYAAIMRQAHVQNHNGKIIHRSFMMTEQKPSQTTNDTLTTTSTGTSASVKGSIGYVRIVDEDGNELILNGRYKSITIFRIAAIVIGVGLLLAFGPPIANALVK